MRSLKAFVASILWVEVAAVAGLLLAGGALTWAERGGPGRASFFTYRVQHFDFLPAWFAATLMLAAINGFWMFRLASIEGSFYTPQNNGWGNWGASLPINPLRLFAINMIAIPAAIGLFLIVRAHGW